MTRTVIASAIALLGLLPLAATAQIHFTASLDGAQEGGVITNGTGTGSFTLSEDFSQLRYIISY
ncbi:MAG TPA: CHRD domain-containing protein [Bacteroidota bacterium]|nr:CHRD domain-containing protein [Bacteroidota bacterium]